MVRNKALLVFSAFFIVNLSVWAGGRQEPETHKVEDPTGFSEKIDISDKEEGMYNFYIEAKDRGGNVYREGPHNIYIDPESDLPVARINNPRENMRIPGNLNIVGTCVDDDAVDHVELVFNDNAEQPARAEGSDFWSYYYDTTGLPDGRHKISVYGVDTNGLKGRPFDIYWHLDRKKPDITLESHPTGALVSGNITLAGKAGDGNGIDSLFWSVDGGLSFLPLDFDLNDEEDTGEFEARLDTRKFQDGPAILWFKAKDLQGSERLYSFLIYVDNTAPELTILYPAEKEPVNGVFVAAGYAGDTVGLKSLSWTLEDESGEFEITVGNPWWVKEFDLRGKKTGEVTLEIRAVDLSDNVTTIRRDIPVNQEADLPTVEILFPQADGVYHGKDLAFQAKAFDDDAVAALLYSVDGGPAAQAEGSGAFRFFIKDLAPGVHRLEVWAKDSFGVEGPRVEVKKFIMSGEKPSLSLGGVRVFADGRNPAVQDYRCGSEFNNEIPTVFTLNIKSGSPIAEISWQFGELAAKTVSLRASADGAGGELVQEIPLPPEIAYGLVPLRISAEDVHGRRSVLEEAIFITDLSVPPLADEHIVDTGSASSGLRLDSLNGESWRPGLIVQIPQNKPGDIPFKAALSLAPQQSVDSAAFTFRDSTTVRASVRRVAGNDYEITANLPELPVGWIPFSLNISVNNGSPLRAAGEFAVVRPLGGRARNIAESFMWIPLPPDSSAELIGTLEDGSFLLGEGDRLVGLYNGKALTGVRIEGEGTSGLSAGIDGYGRVELRANSEGRFGPFRLELTDKNGKSFLTDSYSVIADFAPPSIGVSLDLSGAWVRTSLNPVISAQDTGGLKSLEYSFDAGASWRALPLTAQTAAGETQDIDVTHLEDGRLNILFRAVDEAGRPGYAEFFVHKDTAAPEPQLIVPLSGARVNGMIRLGILVREAGRLLAVAYEAPEPAPQAPAPAGNAQAAAAAERPAPVPVRPAAFLDVMVGTPQMPLTGDMAFSFTDAAGNRALLNVWPFVIDADSDLPRAEVNIPMDNEVLISDFIISGVTYDDDKIARIWYKIDDGEETAEEAENAYVIPIALKSMTDNEHTVTIIPEDIYGVRGNPVVRAFRISLEEPRAQLNFPSFEDVNRGALVLEGNASDKNGIAKVRVSLDNGNSFNDVTGTTDWSYRFDTTILEDGTHVVFIQVEDGYGIPGLYSGLIVVDNTPPALSLEYPKDGMKSVGPVYITGQAQDAGILRQISIRLRSLEGVQIPGELAEINLEPGILLSHRMDLSSLPDGLYNIEVFAIDKAENITRVSRNLELARNNQHNYIETLYPLSGEHFQGKANLYGYTGGADKAQTVSLVVNGITIETVAVSGSGFFRFSLDGEKLIAGENKLAVQSDFGGGDLVKSQELVLYYTPAGPWVTIDSLALGDFAFRRPWLTGRTGYELSGGEKILLEDEETADEIRDALEAKSVKSVEISFDNGKTFLPVALKSTEEYDWRYRLETQDMEQGLHYLLIKAIMENGETAVTKTIIQTDRTMPVIRLLSPKMGRHYNQTLEFSALASDDIALEEVSYTLRSGDKSSYEIPGFIQGLYLDVTIPPVVRLGLPGSPGAFAGGATFMDFGLGLTFFDDNVKLQVQYGFMTQSLFEKLGGEGEMRYGGTVYGVKLLANIFSLPFSYVWGPDYEWLSGAIAVGANFSLFSETQSGSPTMMSAMLLQIEFPRIFEKLSLYTEFQLWFVPTDVDTSTSDVSTMVSHIIMGLRYNIF
ncbi:MAG: hypothetical protein LBQ57_10430 [Spirochaetales bacterium]|jgi:hypothetical protein|nr:hypothetical protein [Spirochaetales bacterium]